MSAEEIARTLTVLARCKAPFLAVTIKRIDSWYNGQIVAEHEGHIVATFGSRLARTLPELRNRLGEYLTFEFKITTGKRQWIEQEITRLHGKSQRKRIRSRSRDTR
jgi:hypothetical protein